MRAWETHSTRKMNDDVTLWYDGGTVKIDTRKNYEQVNKTFI